MKGKVYHHLHVTNVVLHCEQSFSQIVLPLPGLGKHCLLRWSPDAYHSHEAVLLLGKVLVTPPHPQSPVKLMEIVLVDMRGEGHVDVDPVRGYLVSDMIKQGMVPRKREGAGNVPIAPSLPHHLAVNVMLEYARVVS